MSGNLDSPKTTIERIDIIRNKKYLEKVYKSFYGIFVSNTKNTPKGPKVELGSGAGFLKSFIPGVITSDILKLPFLDLKLSAEKLPFKDKSISVFYLLNTFHHIKKPKKALREMMRCLKKGGKIIMIEPGNTIFSRFIYQNYHHEVFDANADWEINAKGALSGSNQALAWIVFKRDEQIFRKLFPRLKLVKYEDHTPFNYLISGGFSRNSLLPAFFHPFIDFLEKKITLLSKKLGLFTTVVLKKV